MVDERLQDKLHKIKQYRTQNNICMVDERLQDKLHKIKQYRTQNNNNHIQTLVSKHSRLPNGNDISKSPPSAYSLINPQSTYGSLSQI